MCRNEPTRKKGKIIDPVFYFIYPNKTHVKSFPQKISKWKKMSRINAALL